MKETKPRIRRDIKREERTDTPVAMRPASHPEDHPELVVRVAGYSTYFTRLPESIQNEVIERTSQTL